MLDAEGRFTGGYLASSSVSLAISVAISEVVVEDEMDPEPVDFRCQYCRESDGARGSLLAAY